MFSEHLSRHIRTNPDRTVKILLVDDEPIFTKVVHCILKSLGYHVTSFTNSLDALLAFKENADSFDLVITDFAMPHMTGIQLTEQILQIRNTIPVIMCSGIDDSANQLKAKEAGVRFFLSKPSSYSELASVVREVTR